MGVHFSFLTVRRYPILTKLTLTNFLLESYIIV